MSSLTRFATKRSPSDLRACVSNRSCHCGWFGKDRRICGCSAGGLGGREEEKEEEGSRDLLCHIDIQELRFAGIDLDCVRPLVLAAVLAHDRGVGESAGNHSCGSDVARS